MNRRTVSLIVIAAGVLALLWLAPNVFFMVFAGILVAVFLRGGGVWIAGVLRLPAGAGIAIFGILVLCTLLGATSLAMPAVVDQIDELSRDLPGTIAQFREWISQYRWGDYVLAGMRPGVSLAEGQAAVTSTFGALGNFLIVIFIGIYGAANPGLYERGAGLLLAPSLRQRGATIVGEAAATLRTWIVAQLMSMTVVGVLTGIGLWLVGVPLAFLLGLIAGLLAFVPILGPIVAAVPGLLIAFPEGWSVALWALAVYIGVQLLESNLITPQIQQRRVDLPAALVLINQVFFGAVFGLLGLVLATPLAAVTITLVRLLYVDYLDDEEKSAGRDAEPPTLP